VTDEEPRGLPRAYDHAETSGYATVRLFSKLSPRDDAPFRAAGDACDPLFPLSRKLDLPMLHLFFFFFRVCSDALLVDIISKCRRYLAAFVLALESLAFVNVRETLKGPYFSFWTFEFTIGSSPIRFSTLPYSPFPFSNLDATVCSSN